MRAPEENTINAYKITKNQIWIRIVCDTLRPHTSQQQELEWLPIIHHMVVSLAVAAVSLHQPCRERRRGKLYYTATKIITKIKRKSQLYSRTHQFHSSRAQRIT